MTTLHETDKLRLEHEHEATFLIEKPSGSILMEDDFYGNPQCGLIDISNNWAIAAGEHLTIWTPEKVRIIEDKNLTWIHSLRVKNQEIVEILVDPWSANSGIWEINVLNFRYRKVGDFDNYKGQEFSKNIKW